MELNEDCKVYLRRISESDKDKRIVCTPWHVAIGRGLLHPVKTLLDSLGQEQLQEKLLNTFIKYIHDDDPCSLSSAFLNHDKNINVNGVKKYTGQNIDKIFNEKNVNDDGKNEQRKSALWRGKSWRKNMESFPTCLGLAIASGNWKMVTLLLTKGSDPKLLDNNNENIMHYVVQLAKTNVQKAVRMYKNLCDRLDRNILIDLLHHRNSDGYKPLDLAGLFHQPEMMQIIINTNHVYKLHVTYLPLCRCVVYDVSDYEGKYVNTSHSLLHRLTEFTEEEVMAAQKCGLFSQEPFNTWSKNKMKAYDKASKVFLTYWFTFVFIYFLKIFLSAYGIFSYTVEVLLILCALFYLITESFQLSENCKQLVQSVRNYFQNHRVSVTFTLGYRLFQLFFQYLSFFQQLGSLLFAELQHYLNLL